MIIKCEKNGVRAPTILYLTRGRIQMEWNYRKKQG